MQIIGELINSSREEIKENAEKNNREFFEELIKKQEEAGANYIDINTGTFLEREQEKMDWLLEILKDVSDLPPCIDSPDPKVIEHSLEKVEGAAMINSISLEEERIKPILPLVKEYDAEVIALCMDDEGMPETADDRLRTVEGLADSFEKAGVGLEKVYFDPLIKPISVNQEFGNEVLETVASIRERYPETHITCGLSNISYGLPQRKILNRAFLVLCMQAGMDSAIIDPLDTGLMGMLKATQALLGNDQFCSEYLVFMRSLEE